MHSMPLSTGNHVPSACMSGVYIEHALYSYYLLYLRLTTRIPGSCLYTVLLTSLPIFTSIHERGPKFVIVVTSTMV